MKREACYCRAVVLLVALHRCAFAALGVARADIYQWEYINPVDPSQGKQTSAMLTIDGAGIDAEPRAYLVPCNLTKVYLIGKDLANARFDSARLTSLHSLTHSLTLETVTDVLPPLIQ